MTVSLISEGGNETLECADKLTESHMGSDREPPPSLGISASCMAHGTLPLSSSLMQFANYLSICKDCTFNSYSPSEACCVL
jgi:hypothetical protein